MEAEEGSEGDGITSEREWGEEGSCNDSSSRYEIGRLEGYVEWREGPHSILHFLAHLEDEVVVRSESDLKEKEREGEREGGDTLTLQRYQQRKTERNMMTNRTEEVRA